MTEIRCKKCNRLLMKADWVYGEIKCPKCGYLHSIEIMTKRERAAEMFGKFVLKEIDDAIFDALSTK